MVVSVLCKIGCTVCQLVMLYTVKLRLFLCSPSPYQRQSSLVVSTLHLVQVSLRPKCRSTSKMSVVRPPSAHNIDSRGVAAGVILLQMTSSDRRRRRRRVVASTSRRVVVVVVIVTVIIIAIIYDYYFLSSLLSNQRRSLLDNIIILLSTFLNNSL